MKSDLKPKWKDAPEWANYLAMSKKGMWHWFQNYPKIHLECEVWYDPNLGRTKSAYVSSYDWQQSLEERPND